MPRIQSKRRQHQPTPKQRAAKEAAKPAPMSPEELERLRNKITRRVENLVAEFHSDDPAKAAHAEEALETFLRHVGPPPPPCH